MPGIVVSRVNMSTKFAKELLDAPRTPGRSTRPCADPGPAGSAAPRLLTGSPCGSPSSRTSTRTCTRSKRCSPRSTRAASTPLVPRRPRRLRPKPNECAALLQERAVICLAGNHDLVVLGKIPIDAFAGEAARPHAGRRRCWTTTSARSSTRCSRGGRARGGALPRQPARPRLGLRPQRRERGRRVRPHRGAARARRPQPRRARDLGRRRLRGEQAPAGTELELEPAAAAQPRLGRPAARRRPRAAWLEIDNAAARATFRRTDYPVERTQASCARWVSRGSSRRASSTASSSAPTRGAAWRN